MQRRTMLCGLAASASVPILSAPALAADKAKRTFRIIRDGDDIGSHVLDAVLGPNGFEIVITIRIAVKVLGITAYRYELDNREVWKGGQIISVKSRVNDDGTDEFADVTAGAGALQVKGSRYTGKASLEAATTSYYAAPFLKRQPWISTQSGMPLVLGVKPEGRANWWTITGALETTLGYSDGEWTGCEFDAGGEPARYDIASQSGKITGLWSQA